MGSDLDRRLAVALDIREQLERNEHGLLRLLSVEPKLGTDLAVATAHAQAMWAAGQLDDRALAAGGHVQGLAEDGLEPFHQAARNHDHGYLLLPG